MTPAEIKKNLKLLEAEFSKEEMKQHPEFMLYLASTPTLDAEKWNNANQVERDMMVKPFIFDFISHNPKINYQKLLSSMTEYNYHTEHKIMKQELINRGIISQPKNKALADMLKYMPTFIVSDGNIEQVTPENFDEQRAKHCDKPKTRLSKKKKARVR